MTPALRRLILLPGLGADGRLFQPQRPLARMLDARLECPDWIEPHRRETLPDYARRLAQTIDPGGQIHLVGISLGGMVALELAHHLQAQSLTLVASCRSRQSVNPAGLACLPLARFTPLWFIHATLGLCPRRLRAVAVAAPWMIPWGLGAISTWSPGPLPPNLSTAHIHGRCDWIIPARRVRPDQVVPRAGHLINLSHARQVNQFIAHHVRRASAGMSPALSPLHCAP